MNDEEYMEIAYQEALKALKHDDVPIGCIIVKDDQIIARAYNQREYLNQTYGHAEMLAIEEACKKIERWRLDECTLYTTLEPCLMCSGAIIQSHIQRVVYGASDTRWMSLDKLIHLPDPKLNYIPMIQSDILKDKCSKLITVRVPRTISLIVDSLMPDICASFFCVIFRSSNNSLTLSFTL